jgi:hypothetical protein
MTVTSNRRERVLTLKACMERQRENLQAMLDAMKER